MTRKQLASYRNWLAELDAEARERGNLNSCDSDIWNIFSPKGWSGARIYASFSDDELLDVVIRSMEHCGHKADFSNIYCIYLEYIKRRFGINDKLKASARARRKNLQNERKFPVDWPDRISIDPLLARG